MTEDLPRSPLDELRLVLVGVGYGTPAVGVVALALGRALPADLGGLVLAFSVASLLLVLVAVLAGRERLRDWLGPKLRPLADTLVFGLLVPWGLFVSSAARWGPSPSGEATHTRLALAEPEVFGLLVLHALAVFGYVVARRRPGALGAVGEVLVAALLLAGIVLHALIAVQLRGLVLLGVLFPPLLPLATPPFSILFLGEELMSRRRRSPPGAAPALCLALLGAWAAGQWAVSGWAPLQAFTRTHGHTLSRLSDR